MDQDSTADDEPMMEQMAERLAHSRYDAIYSDWMKAVRRLPEDPEGTITAARSLIETTCKYVLKELGEEWDDNLDLPKLYHLTALSLGISPTQQTDVLFKSVFGAGQTIVNRIGEMRNKFGDAHGKGNLTLAVPRHHAELALNLAGSICCFVISCYESAYSAKKLIGPDGTVVLRFEAHIVWRLVDHARNAPRWMSYYDKKSRRGLLLVGDSGVYLMSNGLPAMDSQGKLIPEKSRKKIRRLTAPALGCDPAFNAFEDWWPVHNAIADGDDFSLVIPVSKFEKVLPLSRTQIVILVESERLGVMADSQFESDT